MAREAQSVSAFVRTFQWYFAEWVSGSRCSCEDTKLGRIRKSKECELNKTRKFCEELSLIFM